MDKGEATRDKKGQVQQTLSFGKKATASTATPGSFEQLKETPPSLYDKNT